MTMATNAFAQGVFTVSSSIEPRARYNGQTEEAGGITLSLTSGDVATTETGTVTIDYGTTITNTVGTRAALSDPVPANSIGIEICGVSGQTGTTGNTVVSGSTITIMVEDDNECASGAVIDVQGVRLAISGQGLMDVSANITSSGMVRLAAGANDVSVINSVVDELVDSGVTANKITLIRHTAEEQARSATDDGTYFMLHIEENAVDSFNNAELNLDFSGIGAGMSVTIDAWVSTKDDLDDLEATAYILDDCGQGTDDMMTMVDETRACVTSSSVLALSGGDDPDVISQTLTPMSTEAVVKMGLGTYLNRLDGDADTAGIQDDTDTDADETTVMGGGLSDTEIDVVVIRGSIRVTTRGPGSASLPLGDVNIAATVDVGPTGPAVYSRFHRGARPIPRFASDETMAVTVIDVTSDQTVLRIPYAAVVGEIWDTGIAISNTNTASNQMGAITFAFFGGGDAMDDYTTMGGSPGAGLNDDGMLEAGGTYAVQLSDVLEAAGHDASAYSGYLEITTDFTDAEGFVFISSFSGGAWGAAGQVDDITP